MDTLILFFTLFAATVLALVAAQMTVIAKTSLGWNWKRAFTTAWDYDESTRLVIVSAFLWLCAAVLS